MATTSSTDTRQLIAAHPHRTPVERAASLRTFAREAEPGDPELLTTFLLAVADNPDEEPQVRVEALRLLQAIPPEDPAWYAEQKAGDEAAQTVPEPADTAREQLIRLLSDAADPDVRRAAGCALPAMPGAAQTLLRVRRLLDAEPDGTVRRDVAAAMSGHLEHLVTTRAADIAATPDAPATLRKAARAVRTIRVSSPRDLRAVTTLAYACEAASRRDDAWLVASTALGVLFEEDYAIWSPVEGALALLWLHAGPEDRPEVRAVLDVGTALPEVARGPLARRLDGELLQPERISEALDAGEHRRAAERAALEVQELTLLLAYGGSAAWPVDRLGERRKADLSLVRAILY
ncbi:DUF6707 family protein [Peterkaempfera sp. SMS 1(5)a]|uniref:DUF6707 family protein n=1 Tax=Peterkaempfera podocarpi TaxID=3232308 RepID=UPI00366F1C7A